jgi:hypothetical protein
MNDRELKTKINAKPKNALAECKIFFMLFVESLPLFSKVTPLFYWGERLLQSRPKLFPSQFCNCPRILTDRKFPEFLKTCRLLGTSDQRQLFGKRAFFLHPALSIELQPN